MEQFEEKRELAMPRERWAKRLLSAEQFEELGKFQASKGWFDLWRLKPLRMIARMELQSRRREMVMRRSRYDRSSKAARSLKLNGDLSAVANVGGVIGRFFARARCLIVGLILLSLLLAACGGGTGSDTSPDTSQGPVSESPAAQSVSTSSPVSASPTTRPLPPQAKPQAISLLFTKKR